jgi:geranylgeranyl pyrophosphate synthase
MTSDDRHRNIYGSVADDLPLIDKLLDTIKDVEFPWLREMLGTVLNTGGKRLRPALTLLSGQLGSYNLDLLVPMAASVELLHTATLVHDDVIDQASERRGRATAAAQFNNAPSVMLGDYMFAHAAHFVAQTENVRVIRNFAETLRIMARGELSQDFAAYEYSPDVQRYLDRIYGKTASLFATAAEGGAIVCGAPEPLIEPVRRFGEQLGMAFQVVDDVLDFSATAEEMGKPVGSDLLAGTLTLPTLLYLDRYPEDNPVQRAFTGIRRRSNLQRAITEIRESGLLEESLQTASQFAENAHQSLSELPLGEPRATFEVLLEYVLERRN